MTVVPGILGPIGLVLPELLTAIVEVVVTHYRQGRNGCYDEYLNEWGRRKLIMCKSFVGVMRKKK